MVYTTITTEVVLESVKSHSTGSYDFKGETCGCFKNAPKRDNLITLFDYPDEIRKVIYTTNAIEYLNSVIRKTIKNREIFPNDESAVKIIYLAIEQASKK